MFPTNDGNLSLAGILKWIFIGLSGLLAFMGMQAIITGEASPNRSTIVRGEEAQRIGISYLGWSVAAAVAAFLFWFLWQRNED